MALHRPTLTKRTATVRRRTRRRAHRCARQSRDTITHAAGRVAAICVCASLLLVVGCKDEGVSRYDAPKDPPLPDSAQSAMSQDRMPDAPPITSSNTGAAGGTSDASSAGVVSWTVPDHWREDPQPRPMRKATFFAPSPAGDVEVAVSSFPGSTGGLLANINRWRGQVGLGSIDETQIEDEVHEFAADGIAGVWMDIARPSASSNANSDASPNADNDSQVDAGSNASSAGMPQQANANRMVGVIMLDRTGQSWFVKATADVDQIEATAAEIVDFAKSFKWTPPVGAANVGQTNHADHEDHTGHNHDTASQAPVQGRTVVSRVADSHGGAPPMWIVPNTWRDDPAASDMLLGSYIVATEHGDVRMTVSAFPGDVGGVIANINRWRGQIGLESITTIDQQRAQTITISGAPGMLVDIFPPHDKATDPASDQRIVVGMTQHGQDTWFFKISGSVLGVQQQAHGFAAVLDSFQFHGQAAPTPNRSENAQP